LKKLLCSIAGWLLLALAAVGVFIPVLPTTPLVIAATVCFSAGNPQMVRRLENNYLFGPYIEGWRTRQGVTAARKIAAIIVLWGALALSAFITRKLWLAVLLLVVGLAVTTHLLLLKTKKG
jgi:uncharacterized membrane protein YbaN (DUF454 family)